MSCRSRTLRLCRLTSIATTAILICSCTSDTSPLTAQDQRAGNHAAADTGEPGASAPTNSARGAITLRAVDGSEFREVVSQHLGNVVLVDYWATW